DPKAELAPVDMPRARAAACVPPAPAAAPCFLNPGATGAAGGDEAPRGAPQPGPRPTPARVTAGLGARTPGWVGTRFFHAPIPGTGGGAPPVACCPWSSPDAEGGAMPRSVSAMPGPRFGSGAGRFVGGPPPS